MLHAVFLQANQAWCIMDSDNNLIGIGPANQALFKSRKELLRVLKQCGLTLRGNLVEMSG